MRPSPFLSVSAKAECGSWLFGASSPNAGLAARASRTGRTRKAMRCMWVLLVRSALDLPAAVGLATRRAVGLLLLAADDDLLTVLAAVLAARALVRLDRRDRAGVAGVGVLPR